jgi:hypothetical protein
LIAFKLSSEAAYFQSEAAAGRYLAAATSAGQPSADADQCLSELQARAARERASVRRQLAAARDNVAINRSDTVNADMASKGDVFAENSAKSFETSAGIATTAFVASLLPPLRNAVHAAEQ